MVDWIIDTRSGYTHQNGYLKSHELIFTTTIRKHPGLLESIFP